MVVLALCFDIIYGLDSEICATSIPHFSTLTITEIFSSRPNYEARNVRLNSVTGWCGKQEAFTYVSVDLGQVFRVKAILVKGVVTNDIVGRPTEIRFFYKQAESENYVVYFPNFNLTMRDPGNYGELAMITLPKYVQARFVILGKWNSIKLSFEIYIHLVNKTDQIKIWDRKPFF